CRLGDGSADVALPSAVEAPPTGRRLSAGLDLLDRQLVDPDGMMAGKVDDLGIELRGDGASPIVNESLSGPSARGASPIVTEILAGPGALARRIGGKLGEHIAAVHAQLHGGSRDPAAISFAV